jgi:hypothetical protein
MSREAFFPRIDSLANRGGERLRQRETRVMCLHFGEVGDVTDMVARTRLIDVGRLLRVAGNFLHLRKRFEQRATVFTTAAEIVNFRNARRLDEAIDEISDVGRVNVVADLFAFVTENVVGAPFDIALHEVTQEAVQFHTAVLRTSQTTAAQTARRHVEIATILLHENITSRFTRAKERMLRLIDCHVLGDAVGVFRIIIIPARRQFFELNAIGSITVNLVGRKVRENDRSADASRGFEQIESTAGVHVEILERHLGREIVAGLRGAMDDCIRLDIRDRFDDRFAIADIQFVMGKMFQFRGNALQVPTRVAFGAEELGAHVVINAVNVPTLGIKVLRDSRTDQTGAAGNQNSFHQYRLGRTAKITIPY